MNKIIIALLIFLGGISCSDKSNSLVPEHIEWLAIKNGTSFGECLGYCKREIEITKTEVVFTVSSWGDSSYPDSVVVSSISNNEWYDLINSIDHFVIGKMDSVYGCPDCADGGAEWIHFIGSEFSMKITFEYGASLPQIQDVLDKVRAIREKYE